MSREHDARQEYAEQMDHLAKYAQAEVSNLRRGLPMDDYAEQVLHMALQACRRAAAAPAAPEQT